MFFKNYFIAQANILQERFRAFERDGQNPADKGELCEIILRNLLEHSFSNILNIHRGGKIIDSEGNESRQIDILLTAKNNLRIFEDKGIYPVESVIGTFSITATLDRRKLDDCIKEFQSIPTANPRFDVYDRREEVIVPAWKEKFPYKTVFAFRGPALGDWADELNNFVKSNPEKKRELPDLIVVNNIAMIRKLPGKPTILKDGREVDWDFIHSELSTYHNPAAYIPVLLHEIYLLSNWQHYLTPAYRAYFNQEL